MTAGSGGAARWRMVLGRHADPQLGAAGLTAREARMSRALDVVYERGFAERGFRGPGTLDPSRITVPTWLDEVRELFPKSTFEKVQNHAVSRFGMVNVLNSPEALSRLEPNMELMKVLLAFRGRADPKVAPMIRRIVAQVVEELRRRLASQVAQAMTGTQDRFRRGNRRTMANLDIPATIRANLRHYQRDRRAIIAERLCFLSRQKRRLTWTVILCVDQSGSMLNSVIHSAVLASILASLPTIDVKLVVFDTAVVDLSDQIGDPVDLLLSVQLGGGTNIGAAVSWCERLVTQPSRTVLALISDFCEGGSPSVLMQAVRRLAEARVTLIGLAALDDAAAPAYDQAMAARLADAGMAIAALTPDRFAEWLASVLR